MAKHYPLLFLFLFALVGAAHGQPFPGWVNYTAGSHITSLADAGNVLWVGTSGGLVRLDKVSGETRFYNRANSGLSDNWINDVAVDSTGGVWAAVGDRYKGTAFARFDGADWRRSVSGAGLSVSVAVGHDGRVWQVTSTLGSVLVEEGREARYVVDPYNASLGRSVVDSRGDVWVIGTNPVGLLRISSAGITNYTGADSPFLGRAIEALAPDRAGNIWFGTSYGLIRFDGTRWTQFKPPGDESQVTAVAEGAHGEIWVGTRYGAARFDGTAWSVFDTTSSMLGDATVNAIVADRDGVVWFGTGAGLVRYDGTSWRRVGTSNSGLRLYSPLGIIVDRKGARWCIDYPGLVRFDSVWTAIPLPEFGNDSGNSRPLMITAIALDRDDAILVGTTRGLARFDGTAWKIVAGEKGVLPENYYINAIAVARDGTYWIAVVEETEGMTRGIAHLDGTRWTFYTDTNSALPKGSSVWEIAIDSSGDVWASLFGDGVARFDGTSWSLLSDGVPPGLSLDRVYDIAVDHHGALWLSHVGGGVARYDPATGAWRVYDSTTMPELGRDMVISSLAIAPNGGIWLGTGGFPGTDYGAFYIDGNMVKAFPREKCGLPSATINDIAIDSSGNVWFATRGGIGVFSTTAPLAAPAPRGPIGSTMLLSANNHRPLTTNYRPSTFFESP